jgi:hypothetical protein
MADVEPTHVDLEMAMSSTVAPCGGSEKAIDPLIDACILELIP